MADISASQVAQLREETGLPMMEIKRALVDGGGDPARALQLLKERGLAAAAKRSDRSTSEGTLGVYLHSTKKLLASVSLLCETDFVAKNEEFVEVAKKLAMHVAAANPPYVRREDVPEEIVAAERASIEKQLESEGKPKELWEKIVPGKLEKLFQDQCLLEQQFVLDTEVKVNDLVTGLAHKFGENVRVGTVHRLVLA